MSSLQRRFGGAKPFAQKSDSQTSKGFDAIFKRALASGRLNLSSKNLTDLPVQRFLDVASGGVEGVSFWEVVDLRTMDVSHNNIRIVPPCCTDLQSLEVLNAQHNPLQQWPSPFCELLNLKSLDLSNCTLQVLPESIQNLQALVSLSLSNNQLTEINNLLSGGFQSLQVLKVTHNIISQLPTNAIWPSKLLHLDLSNNQMTGELSNCLCMLSELETLDISSNNLQSLPNHLSNLSQLKSLNMRENNIAGIVTNIPSSIHLHTIMLGRNQIHTLDINFLKCPNLAVLDLSENKLTLLPESICSLGYLKTLDCSNNDLENLPHGIGYIASLSRIAVDGNRLRSIRRSLLSSCDNLKKYLRTRGDQSIDLPTSLSTSNNGNASGGKSNGSDDQIAASVIERTRQVGSTGRLDLKNCLKGDIFLSQRTRASDDILRTLVQSKVHTLDLSNNHLTSIPEILMNSMLDNSNDTSTSIQSLLLNDNDLQCLPNDLIIVPLLHLDLSMNQHLSDAVGQYLPSSLISLNLSNIGLTTIPQVIFENLSLTLEKLILNHNVNIGNTVYSNQYPWSNLLKLRELCLASCHIKEFPNDLHLLPVLEIVDVSNNNITEISPSIALSRSIKVLRVDGNGLKSIRYDVVRGGTTSILNYLGKRLPEELQNEVEQASNSRLYGMQQQQQERNESNGSNVNGSNGSNGSNGNGGNGGNSGANGREGKNNTGPFGNNDNRGNNGGGSGSGNGSGNGSGTSSVTSLAVAVLDKEIDDIADVIRLNSTGMSGAKKYAMNKKLKMLKAKRIRAVREANKKT